MKYLRIFPGAQFAYRFPPITVNGRELPEVTLPARGVVELPEKVEERLRAAPEFRTLLSKGHYKVIDAERVAGHKGRGVVY
jgi:hypothetical protein